jgi:hypothetical protein
MANGWKYKINEKKKKSEGDENAQGRIESQFPEGVGRSCGLGRSNELIDRQTTNKSDVCRAKRKFQMVNHQSIECGYSPPTANIRVARTLLTYWNIDVRKVEEFDLEGGAPASSWSQLNAWK